MTLAEIAMAVRGEMLAGGEAAEAGIFSVVASDLMSDVLVAAQDGTLLVTSLASEQVVRTADFVGAAGVVVVNGKALSPTVIELANSLGVALMRSPLPKYEACLALGSLGVGIQGEG